jgi:FkbM family methyltransferase
MKFIERKKRKLKEKIKLTKLKIAGNSYKRWYGSEYGGFFVCEKILNNKSNILVYSCGIGKDISFDNLVLKKCKNCQIYAFDPTPLSIEWLSNQQTPDNFKFFPIGISNRDGKEKMYFPKNHSVSYATVNLDSDTNKDEIEVEMRSIESFAAEHGHTFVDILKMDIEGSEFEVLKNLDFIKIQFGQILVEFHERFFEEGAKLLEDTLAYLSKNGYECFAISDDFEYSFLNKNLLKNNSTKGDSK